MNTDRSAAQSITEPTSKATCGWCTSAAVVPQLSRGQA
jgi:hypothetical protein